MREPNLRGLHVSRFTLHAFPSDFGLLSDFGFRVSDFPLRAGFVSSEKCIFGQNILV
jgi:hypothetical protein